MIFPVQTIFLWLFQKKETRLYLGSNKAQYNEHKVLACKTFLFANSYGVIVGVGIGVAFIFPS